MPDPHRFDARTADEAGGPAPGGPGFFLRPPLAASLIAGLGLLLTVALVSAEGFLPSRDEVWLQQWVNGELPGAERVPDTSFVEFERAGCFGTCPTYTVRVTASGEVQFVGERFVCLQGAASRRIDPLAARRLLAGLGTIDWRAAQAAMAPPLPDAEVAHVRLVLGTQVIEAVYQPGVHGYASKVPLVIERVAGLGAWLPVWSEIPPGGPTCANEAGGGSHVPRWWRERQPVWDSLD